MRRFLLAFLSVFAWAVSCVAMSVEADAGELVVLTSHSEEYVEPIRRAYERQNPSVRLRFLFKKTPAAVVHIMDERAPVPDVFLASASDAFERLKVNGRLTRLNASRPEFIPYDDPAGYYQAVALAAYGAMVNTRYLDERNLSRPTHWRDLLNPAFAGHIGVTSPMRSGTMHVIVENILQTFGWEAGWAYLMELSGNLATITARSYGVADGVRAGRFGVGLVVDFFATKAIHLNEPVALVYFPGAVILPASGAVVRQARSPDRAAAFLDFLRSKDGQSLLLDPNIMRLPLDPAVQQELPIWFPDPLKAADSKVFPFDRALSAQRYQLVNAMFDQLITLRLAGLREVWNEVKRLEAAFSRDEQAMESLDKVRALLTQVPVGDMMSSDATFLDQFSHTVPGESKSSFQIRLEGEWAHHVDQSIRTATARLAEIERNSLERVQ